MQPLPSKDWVVTIVAIALGTALNIVTFAVLWDALFHSEGGISANAVQLLTGWGGGIVGIIGTYVGYRVGASGNPTTKGKRDDDDTPSTPGS